MIYYSKSHKTFFDDGIHDELPSDAQAITQEQHAKLLDALNRGHPIDDDLTVHERPSAAHDWVKGKWVLNQAKAAELAAAELETAKRTKLLTLNSAAQSYIDRVSGADILPAYEVQSWALQGLEAKAWAADNAAATPILDGIAAARGIPADVLKAAALRKTLAYESLCAHIAGQRQAFETRINRAADEAALEAVEIAFTLPEVAGA